MKIGALHIVLLAALLNTAPSLAGKKQEEPPPPEPPVKPGTLAPLECVVADFRALGIDTNDPRERRSKALAWLKKYGKSCTAEQLIAMRNNRAAWLGTADSAEVAARIDGLLEVFAATNREIAVLLYGTPPVTTKPSGDKTKGSEKK